MLLIYFFGKFSACKAGIVVLVGRFSLASGLAEPFPKAISASADERIIFAWITYPSREDRDRINAEVMADRRMQPDETKPMPFDCARMIIGGLETLVGDSASALLVNHRNGVAPGGDQ